MAKIYFAAGCFWHVEEAFRKIPGVKTSVGYMGGELKNPSYEQVCSDKTGHAEVCLVEYDRSVRFEDLLDVFWRIHDPTQLNRQGPDVGTQYRSAIFHTTAKQKALAEKSLAAQQKMLSAKIVSAIEPAREFWRAEEYHQKYLSKRGRDSCEF